MEAEELQRRLARAKGRVTVEVFTGAISLRASGRIIALIETEQSLTAGNLSVYICSYTVTVDGRYIKLPLLQSKILVCILQRGGDPISLQDIFDQIWPDEVKDVGRPHRVDKHLCQLRKNMHKAGCNRSIETVYKAGLRIEK